MTLFVYGLCLWGGLCNLPAWVWLVWLRWRVPHRNDDKTLLKEGRFSWWDDAPLLMRAGVLLSAFGNFGRAWARVWDTVAHGKPMISFSTFGLLSLITTTLAEPLFLRIDEIHAGARGKHSWAWRIFWIGAAGWCAWLMLGPVN